MNDQFYQEEELDLWGEHEGTVEEEQDEIQNHEDLSPEEFDYNDEDEYEEGFEREQQDEQPTVKDDFLTKFLRNHNIDRNKIRFQNVDGTIEEVPFDELDDEDKLAILNDFQSSDSQALTDQEIEDINFLRDYDNLADFAQKQKEQAIREYLEQNATPHYEVDNMDNDQLFVYDLIRRYGEDFTDEEIDAELEKAKENEELFNKKMTYLRNQYKAFEDAQKQAAEQQEQQRFAAEKQELINSLNNAANNVTIINGVELEDTDRSDILDMLTKEDTQGRTEFSKMLSDPEAVFKMAWYMKYGEQTFNTTVDYFKKQIEEARRAEAKPQNRTIVRPKQNRKSDPFGLDSVFE